MKKAFTLIEIMIVVAIIGLLAAIGVPSFINARQSSDNNIKEINILAVNAAKEQWSITSNIVVGTATTWANISSFIGGSVTNQAGLTVNGSAIVLNSVGTSASYP